ncbi:MAG: hypothetical protein LUC24_02130, partial [Bacteroidales bacterium]|nr:hypothetical protein [Bacteroidales bacterium]
NVLSDDVELTMYIDPAYDSEHNLGSNTGEKIADGVSLYESTYYISSLAGLKWVRDVTNGNETTTYTLADGTELGNGTAYTFFGDTVMLEDDIDLGNNEWEPIGSSSSTRFKGSFDGNNFTISNLKVTKSTNASDSDGDYAGLFGWAFVNNSTNGAEIASIRNVVIENATVSGRKYVAVLAGNVDRCDMSNITIKGLIQLEGYAYVGPVTGEGPYGNMTDITVDADEGSYVLATRIYDETVSESSPKHTYVGGVVGWGPRGDNYQNNPAGSITWKNLTSNIDVEGYDGGVGGICGNGRGGVNYVDCSASGNIKITHAYNPFTETDDTAKLMAFTIGGICGVYSNDDTSAALTFTNCSFTGTLSSAYDGQTGDSGVIDLWANTIIGDKYKLVSAGGYSSLYIDGNLVTVDRSNWGVTAVTYGSSTAYGIYSLEGLQWLATTVNSGSNFNGDTVMLTNDISLSGEWTPIGTSSNPFSGTFDGGGHTVSNLTITGDNDYVGLFGYTTGGEVKNLTVENATVSGGDYVGAVVGCPYTTAYSDITVTGDIAISGNAYVGGVGGGNVYNDWTNVTVEANTGSKVSATRIQNDSGEAKHTYVGGIFGYIAEENRTMTNLISNIDVEGANGGTGGVSGNARIGTFVGCSSSGNISIKNAQNETFADEIGGIAGTWNNTDTGSLTFTNCTFTGTLTGTEGYESVDLTDNKIVGGRYTPTAGGSLIIDGVTVEFE